MTKPIESKMVMVQLKNKAAYGPFIVLARCNATFAAEYAKIHFHRQGYYPARVSYPEGLYYVLSGFVLPLGNHVTDCAIPASLIKTYNEPATKSWDQILANPGAATT